MLQEVPPNLHLTFDLGFANRTALCVAANNDHGRDSNKPALATDRPSPSSFMQSHLSRQALAAASGQCRDFFPRFK